MDHVRKCRCRNPGVYSLVRLFSARTLRCVHGGGVFESKEQKKRYRRRPKKVFVAPTASRVWPLRLTSPAKVPSDQRNDNREAFDNACTSSECLVCVLGVHLSTSGSRMVCVGVYVRLPQPLSWTQVRSAAMASEPCSFVIERAYAEGSGG